MQAAIMLRYTHNYEYMYITIGLNWHSKRVSI